MDFIHNLEKNDLAKIVISIIWGLGLAAIFRKVCKGRNCIIIKSPNIKDYEKGVYEFDNKCYTFKSKISTCDAKLDK